MRIFLIIIALNGFLLNVEASNLENLSLKEFLQLDKFNQAVDLRAIDTEMIELGVWHLSNVYRSNKGKYPLDYNTYLGEAAQLHSDQMQMHNFFSHDNKKNKDLSTLDKRAEAGGYKNYQVLAENIYYSSINIYNPQTYFEVCLEIVQAFATSKGHRQNLLANDVLDMGCGIQFDEKSKQGFLYYYFTQNFGKQ